MAYHHTKTIRVDRQIQYFLNFLLALLQSADRPKSVADETVAPVTEFSGFIFLIPE